MEINAFYWDERIINSSIHYLLKLANHKPSFYFSKGNCGDIFNKDLFTYIYGEQINLKNTINEGKRLLLLGSVSHIIKDGDVLSGIGARFNSISEKKNDVFINALRGPISEQVFKKAGYDTSKIQFLYDPGLLIKYIYDDIEAKPSGAIFIPHFSERYNYKRLPKGIRFCDIDNYPKTIVKKILGAELVYTSSLHGIIFAHSLGRKAVLVQPPKSEPIIKYKDYYASVNLPFPKPLNNINEANFLVDEKIPFEINFNKSDFKFPSMEELIDRKVAVK